MTKATRPAFLAFIGALLAHSGAAGAQTTPTEGLRALRLAWTTAYEAGDTAAMAQLYTTDAVRMPYDAPSVVGRAAILEEYGRQFAARALRPDISLAPDDLVVVDGLAIERGSYDEMWLAPTGEVRFREVGKYVSILRRADDDGVWRYALTIFNRDAPR